MNLTNNEITIDEFKFDAVVLHLNCDKISKCLETLKKNSIGLKKIILIDQDSNYVDYGDLVDIHVRTKPIGFSAAANLGIRISRNPYVLVSNDDVIYPSRRWIEGIVETFNKYGKRCLAVNPSSPRNPRASGAEPIDHPDFPYKESWDDDEYDRLLKEVGKGYVIDGICTWAVMFNREKLEKVGSTIKRKCYFDEIFSKSGGQDYALNYNSYLTKNEDNDFAGYRLCGTGGSWVFHYWYGTLNEEGKEKVKFDGNFQKLFGLWEGDKLIEAPDVLGTKGIKNIIKNTIVE